MFIKPKSGVMLRDPVSRQPVPETGKEVSDHDMYWVRRVRDGDAIVTDAPTESSE